MLPKLVVVLGGASSGKSALAERLVTGSGLYPVHIATAEAHDAEMAEKIAAHRAARGSVWRNLEAPLDLCAPLSSAAPGESVLVDCATLWLSNHVLAETDIAAETARLLAALAAAACPVVVVSNEVGQGIVPDNALARRFRVEQGRLNRLLAAEADLVVGVMAGLPFVLKGAMPAWM